MIEYNNDENQTIDHFEIENGHLYAFYLREDVMSKVDLGKVVGEQGPQGPKGPQGANGISPTLSIESDGHLYADYDNPYNPNA